MTSLEHLVQSAVYLQLTNDARCIGIDDPDAIAVQKDDCATLATGDGHSSTRHA